jgi:hypothetical protein
MASMRLHSSTTNMRLAEPVTSITDYILAAEALLFSLLLFAGYHGQTSILLWASGFVALAISALLGGTFHGFQPILKLSTFVSLQRLSALTILSALLLFIAAGIMSAFTGKLSWILFASSAALVAGGIFWTSRNHKRDFTIEGSPRILWIIFSVLAVLFLRHFLLHGNPVGNFMFAGALVMLVGIAVQQQQVVIHPKFNENDLCHVLFMIGLFFLYRGGLLLRDAIMPFQAP